MWKTRQRDGHAASIDEIGNGRVPAPGKHTLTERVPLRSAERSDRQR
jgi:hypothetical protein